MATTQVNVPIQPLMRRVTVHVNVTGVKIWKARMWLGLQLIKLAAHTMGCNIEVKK